MGRDPKNSGMSLVLLPQLDTDHSEEVALGLIFEYSMEQAFILYPLKIKAFRLPTFIVSKIKSSSEGISCSPSPHVAR